MHREHLDIWIEKNGPNGMAKLAIESGVSLCTLTKVRSGYVPTRANTRKRIYQTIGVSEGELFPVLPDGEERAS